MSWMRIKGVILRHLYLYRNSWERITDSFYWPAMDIVLWGLTSQYIQKSDSAISGIIVIFLSGLIFWQVVWRGQYEITVNFLEEVWNQNVVNLFCSPLKLNEWIAGVTILGFLKMLISVIFSMALSWVLYSVNIFVFGWLLIPFLMVLLMSGWWIGLLVTAIIVRFGRQIQTIAWAGVYILAPFSAIYYPVSSLPEWAQLIAKIIPTSYLFEGMRIVLKTGKIPYYELTVAFILNVFYFFIAMIIFHKAFNISRKLGLSRLND